MNIAAENEVIESTDDFPKVEVACLKWGLYQDVLIRVEGDRPGDIHSLLVTDADTLDFYCPGCKKNATFRPMTGGPDLKHLMAVPNADHHARNFLCTRDGHQAWFLFRYEYVDRVNSTYMITKIGQYPALAELATVELKKYRKHLADIDYQEFYKAIESHKHAQDVGGFAYLRRILNRIVEKAHEEAAKKSGWNEEDYHDARFGERVDLLVRTGHLAPVIGELKPLYGILSGGLHEWSEETCKRAFSSVQKILEVMLDEQIAEADKKRKLSDARAALSKLPSS